MSLSVIIPLALTVFGLSLFEVANSADNAIINAEVLSTMRPRGQRLFLTWGLLFAVVVVRGLLPLIIVWAAVPSLGLWGALTASWSKDPAVLAAVEHAAPVLLSGGGTFLIFLFLHWLFMEEKRFGIFGERFIARHALWFYAVGSVFLSVLVWFAVETNPLLAFGATLGSTAFFVSQGFKENAEKAEASVRTARSDFAKLLYLEAIDFTFSIDSVLGAFAFTLSVPLIMIGGGLGALVLRQLTVSNITRIRQYAYLKNGALYSIFALGIVMLLKAFGVAVPDWVSPVVTFAAIGFFFWKSLAMRRLNTA